MELNGRVRVCSILTSPKSKVRSWSAACQGTAVGRGSTNSFSSVTEALCPRVELPKANRFFFEMLTWGLTCDWTSIVVQNQSLWLRKVGAVIGQAWDPCSSPGGGGRNRVFPNHKDRTWEEMAPQRSGWVLFPGEDRMNASGQAEIIYVHYSISFQIDRW